MPVVVTAVSNHPTEYAYRQAPGGAGTAATIFREIIHWQVDNPVPGYIVQKIERNEKYWVHRNHRLHGEQTYQVVTRPERYWECWRVDVGAGGLAVITPDAVDDGQTVHDRFTVTVTMTDHEPNGTAVVYPSKINTRGRFKIRGKVYFVPEGGLAINQRTRAGVPIPDQWWVGNTRVQTAPRSAGRLHARYADPVRGNGLTAAGSLGPVLLTRQFAGRWDWTTPLAEQPPQQARGGLDGVAPPLVIQYQAPVVQSRPYPSGGDFDSRRCVESRDAVTWLPIARRPAIG